MKFGPENCSLVGGENKRDFRVDRVFSRDSFDASEDEDKGLSSSSSLVSAEKKIR